MSDNPFFDSNVLLYLASDDVAKANRAEALLADGGTISVQVLDEISNVAMRKHGMSWSQVDTLLEPVRVLCCIEPLTEATYDLGRQLVVRYRFSVYGANDTDLSREILPLPLWERAGERGEALFCAATLRSPHPALRATFSRKGRRKRISALFALKSVPFVHDAMIVAAALLAEADTLYSEDMHDELPVEDRLRIRNPFRARSVQEPAARSAGHPRR